MDKANKPSSLSWTIRQPSPLPGFGLGLGISVLYLSILVLLPLSALAFMAFGKGWDGFWGSILVPRVLAALKLSFGASLLAAYIDVVLGVIIAWTLTRYRFPFRALIDALVDLPFALPTAVAGIALANLYGPQGWIGKYLALLDIKIAFTPLGVLMAMIFVGLPFTVRSVQPVIQDMDKEMEESAAIMGASWTRSLLQIVLPSLMPALLTAFSLAFARAVGEYGSVIFIAGNLPLKSEIAPLMIVSKLEQFDYTGSAAIACAMLVLSFVILTALALFQRFVTRHLR